MDKHKRRHRARDRDRSPFDDEYSVKYKSKKRSQDQPENGSHNTDSSLSVEETNALRIKLGLTPLDICNESSGDRIVDNQSENFVHAPAKDMKKIKESEKIKDRLNTQKEKRKIYDKLASAKLFEPSEQDLPVTSWVEKLKEKERARKLAQEQDKLLSEMDEQFSVSHLVNDSLSVGTRKGYNRSDLTGLKVEHKADRFIEGSLVTLILKDKDVLDEKDTDVLVNVNMVDDEKAELNRENLRKTAGLAGIADQEDEDVLLGLRAKGVLEKYDTEIKGVQKDEFIIGSSGTYNSVNERALELLRRELREGKQSLPDTELRVASEYYTSEEMESKFKKRKRRVKTRSKPMLTADDLIADAESTTDAHTDVDSNRSSQRNRDTAHQSGLTDASIEPDFKVENGLDDYDLMEELAHEEEEPDLLRGELEATIDRVIRCKATVYVKPEEVAAQLLTRKQEDVTQSTEPDLHPTASGNYNTGHNAGERVVFDSTAEFYKSIGTGFQENMKQFTRQSQLKTDEDSAGLLLPDTSQIRKRELGAVSSESSDNGDDSEPTEQNKKATGGARWHTVGDDASIKRPGMGNKTIPLYGDDGEKDPFITAVLDDEPRLDSGVFSALQLAEKKGYIDKGKEHRPGMGTMINLMAKHIVQEEKRFDDIDSKFSKRDRYTGPLSDFKDLKHYNPDVKLEYVDELGRQLDAKEAFRRLSHKFHGKGSGKKKTEKHVKKVNEEFLLKASTSSDTPLGTAEKLNKKLESISLPYVILSGKNAAVKNLTK